MVHHFFRLVEKFLGAVDKNAPLNLKNAMDAGITNRDVYLFPCRFAHDMYSKIIIIN